ncbi:hypothetical protein MRX96_047738 [Rhipicephalus microplus]
MTHARRASDRVLAVVRAGSGQTTHAMRWRQGEGRFAWRGFPRRMVAPPTSSLLKAPPVKERSVCVISPVTTLLDSWGGCFGEDRTGKMTLLTYVPNSELDSV